MSKHLTVLTVFVLLVGQAHASSAPLQFAGSCQANDVEQSVAREYPVSFRLYVDQAIVEKPFAVITNVMSSKSSVVFTIRNPHTGADNESLWESTVQTDVKVGNVTFASGSYNVTFAFEHYKSVVMSSPQTFNAEVRAQGESNGKTAGLYYTCRPPFKVQM